MPIPKKNTPKPGGRKPSGSKASPGGPAKSKKIRYAVVGLGYFSQSAILPAFAKASSNSELTALVSDDPEKRAKLARKYKIKHTYDYDNYQELLSSGEIDAVFIALPNDMHKEFSVRASMAGVHVLCEKPMAVTERDCEEMIRAANEHHARLMVAYRLHIDEANLKAIEAVKSGGIGEPRFFNSAFSMQVKEDNIRVKRERGGGSVADLGIYCINAARYLFQDEPFEVVALSSSKKDDPRFEEVDEMTSAILRFPGDRQATFTSCFGAADTSWFEVLGTEGSVCLDQAYDYALPSTLETTIKGKTKTKTFAKKDQVAGEIVYFSDCIRKEMDPEPSGLEGLADVRVINAIYESARTGKPVSIDRVDKRARPSKEMEVNRPPSDETELFHAEAPSQD
ncbi:MAG: putative dehydrogenase [Fibrobacteres bacterium]|nr:putative dehydrogenase [Fibrobacterota bacterium]